MLGEDRTG